MQNIRKGIVPSARPDGGFLMSFVYLLGGKSLVFSESIFPKAHTVEKCNQTSKKIRGLRYYAGPEQNTQREVLNREFSLARRLHTLINHHVLAYAYIEYL